MKCVKCGKEIANNSNVCSFCGHRNVPVVDDLELELPALKEEHPQNIDQTIAMYDNSQQTEVGESEKIGNLDQPLNLENPSSSLDDINNQPSEFSDFSNENSSSSAFEPELSNPDAETSSSKEPLISIASPESVNKRKKILITTCFVSLILLIVVGFAIFKMPNKPITDNVPEDYISNLDRALQDYYDTGKIDDVIYLLNEYQDNPESLANIQNRVNEVCLQWLDNYFNADVSSKSIFDDLTAKYQNLFNGLYEYAVVIKDENYIRALSSEDRDNYNTQVDNIYNDSGAYYEAYELYSEKDYDKAYYMFDQVPQANMFYPKAQECRSTILNNVLTLLENDIKKMSANIEDLSPVDKLKRYKAIQEVIKQYDNIYENLNLKNQESYLSMLNDCLNKINEYSAAENSLNN